MRFLVLLAALLWVAPALADVRAKEVDSGYGRCFTYQLCDAEGDAALPCRNAAGTDTIVARLMGRYSFGAYVTSSDATTTITCDLYTSDNGYSATKRQALTSASAGTTMTLTQQYVAFSASVDDVWAECSAIVGGGDTVTLNLLACPLTP